MSTKRTAPYSVDKDTHQVIDNNQDNNNPTPKEGEAPAQRTIFKVVKDEVGPKHPEPTEQQQPPKKLFENLFNNNNGTGLFSGANIFSSVSNIFNQSKIDINSPNLFTGNGSTNSLNIFKNNEKPGEKSIFGFGANNNLPPVRAGEEDEEGDSEELERKQNLPIDKSKSSGKYEYQEEVKNLFTAHVKKYKKNDGDAIENVEVLVQLKEETNTALLVVRLPVTKHPIYAGLLLPGTNNIRIINNKQQNVEVAPVSIEEGKKPIKDRLKMQFDDVQTSKKFQEIVTPFFEVASKSAAEKEKTAEKEGEEKKA